MHIRLASSSSEEEDDVEKMHHPFLLAPRVRQANRSAHTCAQIPRSGLRTLASDDDDDVITLIPDRLAVRARERESERAGPLLAA